MVAFYRFVAVVAVLIVTAVPTLLASDADNAWLIDTVIPSLLRFNMRGHLVSSDLGDYVTFDCTGVGKHRTCAVDKSRLHFPDISNPDLSTLKELIKPSPDGSMQSYVSGVALYAIIAIIAGFLVIILTLLYLLCFRIVCGTLVCMCENASSKKRFKQSQFPKGVLQGGAAVMSCAFFAFLATMVILAYSLGVKVAFDGITDVADAPLGVAQITYQFSLAMEPTFIGVTSKVVLPTLHNLNSTLCGVVHWEAVITDLQAINDTVHHLPDFGVITERLAHIDNSTEQLNLKLTAIFNFNDDYAAKKQLVSDRADVVQTDLDGLHDDLLDLRGFVHTAQDSTSDLSDAWSDLYGPEGPGSYSATDQTGYIDSVEYDIAHMARSDTAGDGIPTTATLNSAATGATASVARLLSGDLDGSANLVELRLMNTKLHNIYDSVIQMPNFADTASNLLAINNTITSLIGPGGAIKVLPSELTAIQNQLDNMPNATLIKIHVTQLLAAVDDLNGDTLSSLLEDSNTLMNSIPVDIAVILTELDKVGASIRSVRAPMYDLMVVQPRGFNETIMESPYDGTKIFTKINDTMTKAAASADTVTVNLRDLNDQILDEVDITSFITTINDAQGDVKGARDNINRTALYAALDAATITTTFNATQYRILLKTVTSSLGQAKIYPEMIQSFNALETLRSNLETQLRDSVGKITDVGSDNTPVTKAGDYQLLAQGVCSTDTTKYCSLDTDCSGGGTCTNIGVYRCSANGDPTYAVTHCTQDSDCATANTAAQNGGSSHCLADTTDAMSLRDNLLALAVPGIADFGQDDVKDSFDALRTASASFDVDQLNSDLTGLVTSIDNADTTSAQAQITSMQNSLDSDSLSITDVLDPLRDTQSDIGSLDFSDITGQLDDVQEQIDKYAGKLEDYIGFAEDLQYYIFNANKLKSRWNGLTADHLNTVLDDKGFGAVLMSTGQTFESTIDDVIAILDKNDFHEDRIELTKSLRTPALYFDRLTGNEKVGFYDVHDQGATYYMMQLSNATAKKMVNARDSKNYLILTDSNGDRYEDGRYCLTRDCFTNQEEEYANGPYTKYLPLVLAPLAVVALIALCNFGCVFVSPKIGCCRKCMPVWMLCMIIVIVPWYLIFSGYLFAFFIAFSDGCTSGPQIAANYITSYGDAFCDRLGGNGTLAACNLKNSDLDVTINLQKMANVVLGVDTCSGDPAEDPFYVPLHDVGNEAKSFANTRTRREINKKDYRKFRPTVKNIVLDASDGAADVVHDFLDTLGNKVVTCENMHDMLYYMKKPVCYSVIGPWTWLVGTIYLAAWSMCCLGIPTGCALKNTFKWEAIEADRDSKNLNPDGTPKNSMLKNYMLGLRGRGPMVGRNMPVPTSDPDAAAEGGAGDEEDGGAHAHAGGAGGHAQRYAPVGEDGDEDGGEGGGGPVPVEEVKPSPGGGYMARYPKYATSSKDGEKFIAEGGRGQNDEEKSQDSEGEEEPEMDVVVHGSNNARAKV